MERRVLLQVLEAFTATANTDVLDEPVEARLIHSVQRLRAVIPEAELSQIFAALSQVREEGEQERGREREKKKWGKYWNERESLRAM